MHFPAPPMLKRLKRTIGKTPSEYRSKYSCRLLSYIMPGGQDNQGELYPHSIIFMSFAGLPPTMVFGATSFVTTALAATTAFSPTVTPGRIVALAPIHALRQMWTGLQTSSAWSCRSWLLEISWTFAAPFSDFSAKQLFYQSVVLFRVRHGMINLKY